MLPLRVPIMAGEALDSWLEALARRSQVTVGTLTAALGWPVPATPGGLVAGIPGQVLRRIEDQAGLPAGRLDVAVLDRHLPLGPVRRRGSRYCPSCLAERDGRWLLAWRLGWTFACTTHRVLLCDTCPGCGQAPRGRGGRAGLNPPGTCPNTIKRTNCCSADLRQATADRLAPGHPVLAAQHWTAALFSLDDTPSAGNRVAAGDLGIVASWVLRQAPGGHVAGSGPQALAAWREWDQHSPAARRQPRRIPPASAALTGTLAATAMTVLAGSDEQAIDQIRALLPRRARPQRARPAGLPAQRWQQLSPRTRSRFLRALDPDLIPADRIRYRTSTPQAAIPDSPPGLLAARARAIPQLLWPEWAIRLMPARGFAASPFRSTIAACLLLPGHPGRATRTAITALHAYRSALAIGTELRALAGNGHDTVLTAITCLAGYLDTCGSPIDYQRWSTPGLVETRFSPDALVWVAVVFHGTAAWRNHGLIIFSAFVLSNICPAALSSCPAWWRAAPARPARGVGHLLVGHPALRRGFPGLVKGDASASSPATPEAPLTWAGVPWHPSRGRRGDARPPPHPS